MAEDTEDQKRAEKILKNLMTPESLAAFRRESERALKEFRRKQRQRSEKK